MDFPCTGVFRIYLHSAKQGILPIVRVEDPEFPPTINELPMGSIIKHKSRRQKPSGFALTNNRSVEQFVFLAPRAGLEPATKWLTATRSTC